MGLQGLWIHLPKGMCHNFFVLNIRFLTFDELFVFRLIPRKQSECAGMFFEEQGPGFRCPQCSGPRRRYAKKVGDVVGTTLDGGDAPILIFSFGGVIATILFGIWAVENL